MDKPKAPSAADRQAELMARALAHIESHLDQPLTAEVLADKAAMSRHHFHRVFFAYVGCSVGAYVTWRRLQRASALLASGHEPVLEIALEVGYESAQALAKAMRRELGSTPTAVRRGNVGAGAGATKNRPQPWRVLEHRPKPEGDPEMQVTRMAQLPPGLAALTATARGMVDRTLMRAAQQAFGELKPALERAGLREAVASWISLCPDDAQGPDDPHCRYVAGVVFGYCMANGAGQGAQQALPLSGSLAWQALAPGRYAVFTHVGPYALLHRAWAAIYRDWLPASGEALRDDPPLELMLNSPELTPPEALRTEIWIPLV